MRRSPLSFALGLSSILALVGCKEQEMDVSGETETEDAGTEGEECVEDEEDACEDGLVCEGVADGEGSVCAEPIEVRGMVIDALTEVGIEGALVIALDSTGAPVTDVAMTDADGNYTLAVPVLRDADGKPVEGAQFTLQGTADDYQAYPSGLRPAFPISADDVVYEAGGGTDEEIEHEVGVIENPSTTIALIPLEDTSGRTVSGWVEGDEVAGALVVAEGSQVPAPWAITDRSGEFTIFNGMPRRSSAIASACNWTPKPSRPARATSRMSRLPHLATRCRP
jgi:hypothetical protein